MRPTNARALAVLCLALLAGCAGKDGAKGTTALVSSALEAAGANCPAGGARIDSGLDANANGTLDAAEVSATRYVCDGADAVSGLVATALEAAGPNCPAGGLRVTAGPDADHDGMLDAGEVATTSFVCDGVDAPVTLLVTAEEPAGTNCAAGGARVQTGLDADADGALAAAEVTSTRYVCNGAAATDAVVVTATEPPGPNCVAGGVRVSSGLDLDRDGTLDAGEVQATSFVCDAAAALVAIVRTTAEPAGANCAYGGSRVESGLDADLDGALDAGEVSTTSYVCAADTRDPEVVAFGPASGAAGVATSAIFTVTFSEPVDPASLTAATLWLEQGGVPVAGAIGYQPGALSATFTPAGQLTVGLQYDLEVTPGVRDLEGNGLIMGYSAQWVVAVDDVPPSILSLSPRDGGVTPAITALEARFDEPLMPSSAAGASITLADGAGAPVAGTLSHDAAAGLIRFAPGAALVLGTTYTATLAAMAADPSGNMRVYATTWSFTVGAPEVVGAPTAAAEVQAGGVLRVRVPVNEVTQIVRVWLTRDLAVDGNAWAVADGARAAPGDTFIDVDLRIDATVAPGDYALALLPFEPTGANPTWYVWHSLTSGTDYASTHDLTAYAATALPINFVRVTDPVPPPASRPDLSVTIDAVAPGATAGTLDVSYTVRNTGGSDAGAFALGLYANAHLSSHLYWYPEVSVDVAALAAGASVSGVATVADETPGATFVYASVDYAQAVEEVNEENNEARYRPAGLTAVATGTLAAPVPIVDNATNAGTVAVSGGPAVIRDLTVQLDATHTYMEDVTVELVSPGGVSVVLIANRGGSANNMVATVFDDFAVAAIGAGAAPFTGTFRPEQRLGAFVGLPADGTWTVRVSDNATIDTGTLTGCTITFY